MVLLTTATGGFEAKCLAAQLGAEGVLWELRGAVDGVYPLGTVDVYVDAADLSLARDVLGHVEPVSVDDAATATGWTRSEVAVLLGGAVGLAGIVAARVLTLG